VIYFSCQEVNHQAIHVFQIELDKKFKKMHFRAKGHVLTQSHWVNDELTHHISPSGPCILIWALLMHLRRQLGDQTL